MPVRQALAKDNGEIAYAMHTDAADGKASLPLVYKERLEMLALQKDSVRTLTANIGISDMALLEFLMRGMEGRLQPPQKSRCQ